MNQQINLQPSSALTFSNSKHTRQISGFKDPCPGCVWGLSATGKRRQGRRKHATESGVRAGSPSGPAAPANKCTLGHAGVSTTQVTLKRASANLTSSPRAKKAKATSIMDQPSPKFLKQSKQIGKVSHIRSGLEETKCVEHAVDRQCTKNNLQL
jgi:hypothetical protein